MTEASPDSGDLGSQDRAIREVHGDRSAAEPGETDNGARRRRSRACTERGADRRSSGRRAGPRGGQAGDDNLGAAGSRKPSLLRAWAAGRAAIAESPRVRAARPAGRAAGMMAAGGAAHQHGPSPCHSVPITRASRDCYRIQRRRPDDATPRPRGGRTRSQRPWQRRRAPQAPGRPARRRQAIGSQPRVPGRDPRGPRGTRRTPCVVTSTTSRGHVPLKDTSSKASATSSCRPTPTTTFQRGSWPRPRATKSFGSMIHPTIELLGQDVRVLVEQTTAVDPQRLGDFAGRLDPDEFMEINVALRAVLDLE